MKKPNKSVVAVMRYATFALTLAGTLSVFADRKWTAGGGDDTDWTNDANWDSGTGTRLFNQENWTATDNTINVSFTNRTTESGNAFFIQSKTDTVVFNAASDEAGLDITVPNSGNWWVQNFYVGTDAQNGAWVVNGGTYSIGGGSLYIGHNGNNRAATGSVTIENGSLTLGNALLVGAGGAGSLEVKDGTLAINGVLDVANAGTGTFAMSNGTVTASKYMRLGYGANSVANVYISGGELTAGGSTDNKNYYGLMLADNDSSTATFTIDGGTATFIHDSNIGWNGSGTLNIGGTGKVSVGTASAHKWVRMNTLSAATGKSVINLSGNGILDICHVELDNGTGEINFDGGAIHAYANNGSCGGVVIAASDNLTVNVKEGGAAFDVPSGVSVSIAEPLLAAAAEGNTDGGLVKKGDGTLTLASGNTYAGPTVVEGGSLVLPVGGSLASTKLELAGGTFSGTTFDDITISAGAYSFSSLPTNTTSTVTLNGGVLRMTVAEAQATADTATVVVNGGTLLIDGNTAESVSVGSSFTFANVTLGDNVEVADVVKVSGVNFDWTYGSSGGHPTAMAGTASGENVWVGGATGNWSDAANWSYGVPSADLDAVFTKNVVVTMPSETTFSRLFLRTPAVTMASSGGKFHLKELGGHGVLTLENTGLTQTIASGSDLTVTNDIVITGSSWLGDWNSDSVLHMKGRVSGTGTFGIWKNVRLYGDNSSFAGAVKKNDYDSRFMTPQAGFPNASAVTIDGTIWLWFNEGEIEFGGNFTAWSTGNCGINLPGAVRAVTMTVGGGNGSVIISRGWDKKAGWRSYYSAFVDSNGWQQGTDKFTLRKVGTGAITEYGVQSVYNFSLEGGSINLGAEKVYTGPDTRLTVANATLGIAAATTVAAADFQSGSTLQSTYYETTEEEPTTYGVNLLTVTGAATLNGLTLTAAGTTPNVDTTYTVLSAASVSGSAESGVADSDETDKKVWIAKVRPEIVKLMYGSKYPGFFVIIH